MRWYELKRATLFESARIQHAEDLIFWQGSIGAAQALESLKAIESGNHQDVTVKWDGSPAVIFGRDADGKFMLTDKSGFTAKGYDGRAKSAKDLEKMLLNRKLSKGQPVPDSYAEFAGKMRNIYSVFESAVPENHQGYFKGDLLYYNTPTVKDNKIVFTPNVVTYTVDKDSEIGAEILKSKSGVVVHNEVDLNGNDKAISVDVDTFFLGSDLLVMPPISMSKAADIDDDMVKETQQLISANKVLIDKLLDKATLTAKKLSDFSNLLYSYANSKVDSGMQQLGKDFFDWLTNSKVSEVKQKRLSEHIRENSNGFTALWQIFAQIQMLKDSIINQFDNHDMPIKATIGASDGGEGYVMTRPWGTFKLVDRAGFTAANRAIER